MNFMTSISFCDVMLLWASYLLLEDSAAQTIHLAEFNKSACKTDCTQGLQSFTYKCQFTSIVKMENSGFENGDLTLLFKNEITGKFEPLSSVQRLQDCDDFSNRSDYTCFRHDTKMFNISMYVKTNLLYEGAEVKFKIIINTNTTVYSNARHVIGLTDMPDPSHVAGYLTVNGQSALINECNIKIAGEHLEINFKCHAFTKECAIQMDINGGQEIKYSTNSIEFNQTLMVASEVNVHIKFSACTLDENVTSFNCTFKPGTLDKSSPVETTTIIIATSAVGSLIVIICIICIAICVRYLKKKKGNTKSQPRGQQEGASRIPEQEKLLQQTETKTGKESLLEDIDGAESGQLEDTCFIDMPEDTYSLDESSDKAGNEQSISSLSHNSREEIIFEKNNIQGFIQSQAIVNDLLDNNARRLDEDFVGNEEAFSSPSDDSPLNRSLTIVNDSMQDNLRKVAKECVEEHLENKLSKGKLVIDPHYLKKFGPCFYESLKKIWKKGSVIVKEDVRHKREFQQIDHQDIDLIIKMANKFTGNFILNSESEKEQKEATDIFQIGHDFNDYIIRFTTMLINNFQETLRKDHQNQKSVETSKTFPEKREDDCTIKQKKKSIKEIHGNQIKWMVRIFTEPERKEQTGHKSVELCQLIQDNSEKDYTIKQKVSDIKEKHGTQLMKMADLFTEHLKVGKEDQKEEKEYPNAAATNEQLAQHMSLLEFPCVNSQNHNIFVSVKEFKRDHLPSLYRVGELYDLIMLSASLTVKVLVTSTSNERDGDSLVPTITNLTDFEKEIKAIRRGTGRVIHVQKNLDGDNQRCPCHGCKISSTPNPVQGNIYICTSKKIIYDDKEAENSKCILDFAFRNCETISLSGSGNNGFRVSKDCCVLMYQTCNHNLLQHLEAKINEYNNVYDKVHHTFKGSSEKHRLAVIVSNPHGFSKQVSVGEWVEKKNKCANTYYYTYNTLACEGSVGAHVFILGSSSSVLFNQHIHLGKENETELNHSCVNTSIREFNLC